MRSSPTHFLWPDAQSKISQTSSLLDMICARCLRRASSSSILSRASNRSSQIPQPPSRSITSSRRLLDRTPISPNVAQASNSHTSPPPATSTSAAQPFSSKDTLSPETEGTPSKPAHDQQTHIPKSSVPPGTPLVGINYFKNKEDPIAMEDHEYPDWLWELLAEKKQTMGGEEAKDPRLYGKFI